MQYKGVKCIKGNDNSRIFSHFTHIYTFIYWSNVLNFYHIFTLISGSKILAIWVSADLRSSR